MMPPYRCFGSASEVTTIDLSGARTATAMNVRPRIMTPSRTAWPPYEILGVRRVWPDCSSTGAEALMRRYFFFACCKRRWKRSTWPAVSTRRCSPVKNG